LLTRRHDDSFCLRFGPPFTLLHAFSLAVANFHTGLAHR
jgi:hypothetical protein